MQSMQVAFRRFLKAHTWLPIPPWYAQYRKSLSHRSLRTHVCKGRKEVDPHGSAFGAIKDYWTNHNLMNNFGSPENLIDLDRWQCGASWSCCNVRADFPGCTAGEHNMWAKVHIIPEPTLKEADNGQVDEQGARGSEPIIGKCKACHMNMTEQSLLPTECFHHPGEPRCSLARP